MPGIPKLWQHPSAPVSLQLKVTTPNK